MPVRVAQRLELGVSVVEVHGELDLDGAPMLRAVLADLLDRGVIRIVVDVSRVRFCDSVGLSALLFAHRACDAAGGFLRLAAPDDAFTRLLTVVGLAEQVLAFSSIEAAAHAQPST